MTQIGLLHTVEPERMERMENEGGSEHRHFQIFQFISRHNQQITSMAFTQTVTVIHSAIK